MIKPFLTELRAVFKSAIGHSLGVLTLALGAVLILAGLVGSDQVEANRAPTPIAVTLDIAPSTATTDADVYSTVQVSGEQAGYNASWRDMEVRKGDSLSMIFGRAGLNSTDLQSVLDADARSKSLRSIYPGQTVSIKVDSEGRLSEMRYARSPLETRIFTRNGEGFSVGEETRSPEVRKAFRHANLKSSLFEAGQEAGLSGRMILELASVFGGVIDFVLDPRAGDSFSVLYEEQYLDGEKVGEGAIIAAEYVNDGKRFAAYRYTDSNGDQGYFSADGVSMRKA
ncbi:MAG: peptidase M23, partial [Verrucomicrobia bacterium]|nr:peptidase M23 [Verrucomicrobiota bacterium]